MTTLLSIAGLHDDRHTAVRLERILAISRAVLAFVSLFATQIDPTEPAQFAPMVTRVLLLYSSYSLAVLVLLWARPRPKYGLPLQTVDIIMAAMLTFISEGPSSPFFPLFIFVVVAAAYRRGLRATLIASVWIVGLLVAEALVIRSELVVGQTVEVNRIIIRITYVLLAAFLVGYLAEREKQLRAEALLVAKLTGLVRMERGLSGSLQAVLAQLIPLASADHARLVFRDDATGRTYLWTTGERSADSPTPFRWRELSSAETDAYTFELPPRVAALQAVRRPDGVVAVRALDTRGRRIAIMDDRPERLLTTAEDCGRVICLTISVGPDSLARVFFGSVAPRPLPLRHVAVLQRIVQQIFPPLYNLYLLRRLRTRAGELERARVARELHDGVIQSLMGLEMHLEVARRSATNGQESLAARLASIQGLLHQEVLNVRDLMQQMRPLDADARNLLQIISDLLERFRRETGVHTQFVSELERVNLSPRTCRELARIVQEALVNVRRHSGAANVVVRFGVRDSAWMLSIDDDGRGFDFAGRMSHDALESARKGPIVIRERVRAIGGTLAIESTPGSGSRLEIAVPQKLHG